VAASQCELPLVRLYYARIVCYVKINCH
jgi:hypothetical protein